jgi:hypothetical protein
VVVVLFVVGSALLLWRWWTMASARVADHAATTQ